MALNTDAKVLRGKESWAYIYAALGFALAIEGSVVQMLVVERPWSFFVYLALVVATGWFFICSGQFQDRLIGFKDRLENTPR